jgi:Na+-transporting NADH:ubiquinone oxidoreductase subunit NqrC
MTETEAIQEGITMMILFIAALGIITAMFVNHFKKAEQHRQMMQEHQDRQNYILRQRNNNRQI